MLRPYGYQVLKNQGVLKKPPERAKTGGFANN